MNTSPSDPMVRGLTALLSVVVVLCQPAASVRAQGKTEQADARSLGLFHDYVEPLLKARCYECHSHDSGAAEGGLVLDSRSGWATGGALGAAIVAGRPDESLLMRAVGYEDVELQMPPDGKLSDEEISHLRQWIELGAADPRVAPTSTGRAIPATPQAEELWSVQPLAISPSPRLADTQWPRTDIDRFILARLEASHITPSVDAPPYVLLNRLHYVLSGLPPTPDETARFLAAAAQGLERALAQTVEELLESRGFGVRWGRHWLDIARYADSPGTTNPKPYTEAWRYRNYVIDSFCSDKPFDRFVREQIAGDLLVAETPAERVANLIATGFISLGHVLGADRDLEKLTLDRIDEQLDVIGTSLLGIRLGCARCHDHKLDPVPTRDYYALAGIFRSTQAGPARRMGPGLRPAGQLPSLAGDIPTWMAATERTRFHGAEEAEAMRDEPIHLRGAVELTGDIVPRGFLSLVALRDIPPIPADMSGRLELSEWLLSPQNPLVLRVIVNRVWHYVFGQGIVRTTDNFGFTGDSPSHPELLDFLANRFREDHRWSFKALIREMVTSRAWRQSSDFRPEPMETDPDNRWLWRANMRRMDAEALVDSVRFVAGQLDLSPADRTVPDFNVGNQGSTRNLQVDDAVLGKRAVYWPVFRKDVPVAMDVLGIFDFPPATAPRGAREVTRVPAQSLSLLNSPLVLDAARSLARDVQRLDADDTERLHRLHVRLFARPPSPGERNRATRFLERFGHELAETKAAKPERSRAVAWNRLCHSLLVCNEFLVVE